MVFLTKFLKLKNFELRNNLEKRQGYAKVENISKFHTKALKQKN